MVGDWKQTARSTHGLQDLPSRDRRGKHVALSKDKTLTFFNLRFSSEFLSERSGNNPESLLKLCPPWTILIHSQGKSVSTFPCQQDMSGGGRGGDADSEPLGFPVCVTFRQFVSRISNHQNSPLDKVSLQDLCRLGKRVPLSIFFPAPIL